MAVKNSCLPCTVTALLILVRFCCGIALSQKDFCYSKELLSSSHHNLVCFSVAAVWASVNISPTSRRSAQSFAIVKQNSKKSNFKKCKKKWKVLYNNHYCQEEKVYKYSYTTNLNEKALVERWTLKLETLHCCAEIKGSVLFCLTLEVIL